MIKRMGKRERKNKKQIKKICTISDVHMNKQPELVGCLQR